MKKKVRFTKKIEGKMTRKELQNIIMKKIARFVSSTEDNGMRKGKNRCNATKKIIHFTKSTKKLYFVLFSAFSKIPKNAFLSDDKVFRIIFLAILEEYQFRNNSDSVLIPNS